MTACSPSWGLRPLCMDSETLEPASTGFLLGYGLWSDFTGSAR